LTFKNFKLSDFLKFSDFNEAPTNSLIIKIETCRSVLKCFKVNILDYYIIVLKVH